MSWALEGEELCLLQPLPLQVFPGMELVGTPCSTCSPGVAAHGVTPFSVRFLGGFSRAFRSGELRETQRKGIQIRLLAGRLVLSESLLLIQVELGVLVQNGSQMC